MIKIGLAGKGGNYQTIKSYINKNNIDTSHFLGQGSNKGRSINRLVQIEVKLVKGKQTNSYRLKKQLIKSNIKQTVCESCNLTKWLEKPIPLELDHIDGDNTNNELINLRLLCPNCHALTPTYRGLNKKNK